MSAAVPHSAGSVVQLTLDLCAPSARRARSREERPFWDYIDNADVGGSLCAKRPGARVVLSAIRQKDGSWIGSHDLLFQHGGSSDDTKPQLTRADALATAAYQLKRYCDAMLAKNGSAPNAHAAVARQLLSWLARLDLL